MKNLRFFIDFDGTITRRDVVDMLLERFASEEWKNVEREWIEGKIGSRECLSRQIELVSATEGDVAQLLSEVQMDPFFIDFLRSARSLSVPVAIVSDGFDLVIRYLLEHFLQDSPELLQSLTLFSNKLRPTSRGFKAIFPEGPLCEHACANCKPRVMKNLSTETDTVIFVGDGLSDRFAARAAHLTFAKGKLLDFCEKNEISHKKYSDFKEVEEWLSNAELSPNNGYTGSPRFVSYARRDDEE